MIPQAAVENQGFGAVGRLGKDAVFVDVKALLEPAVQVRPVFHRQSDGVIGADGFGGGGPCYRGHQVGEAGHGFQAVGLAAAHHGPGDGEGLAGQQAGHQLQAGGGGGKTIKIRHVVPPQWVEVWFSRWCRRGQMPPGPGGSPQG
ncbi:hypothetical protein B5G12_01665 [Faecalibacterium sp. An58]|nr:hypothetical protein B5G12_01665 [Faecalibacterium sp. An58]